MNKLAVFDSAIVSLNKGISLIEASAGTGKTYAIAMLVLRLAVEKNIPIDKILVVTFTKASTEELRGRIRSKLIEARNCLLDKEEHPDPTMLRWLKRVDDLRPREDVVKSLEYALADIDLLAVFTIHGFCQRMLVEQALESGQLFDVELSPDVDSIKMELVEDFWRNHLYTEQPGVSSSFLLSRFSSPEKVWQSISRVFAAQEIIPETTDYEFCKQNLDKDFQELKTWWGEKGSLLKAELCILLEKGCFKKAMAEGFEQLLDEIDSFFLGHSVLFPKKIDRVLNEEQILENLNSKKVKKADQPALIQSLPLPGELFSKFMSSAETLVLAFRYELAKSLKENLEKKLKEKGVMSFDDLILRFAKAVEGENRRVLGKLFDQRFKAALIDEFQDTDRGQWTIFSNLFGGGAHYLYLIGDPKQAIYKFRGADIFSYFIAKKTAKYRLTLDKNYRSHPVLVRHVNALFGNRQRPFYFDENMIGYQAVEPAKTEKSLFLSSNGTIMNPFVYVALPESDGKDGRWTSGAAGEFFIRYTVAEINRLLSREKPVYLEREGSRDFLRPQDIAILVRSHKQAEQFREVLAEHGVPAVLNSKKSIFETRECEELWQLLQAFARPGDIVAMKAAMTVSWLGITGDRLVDILQDDHAFDQWIARFAECYGVWKTQGILAAVNHFFERGDIWIKIAERPFAERVITNVYHLFELVQRAESEQGLSMGQTIRWLQYMMKNPAQENSELRLESDGNAVQIVTMHGAKGLEYPVVFCPFLWYRKNLLGLEKYQLSFFQENKTVLDIGSDHFEHNRNIAVEEELAEELRLLYVSLTRGSARQYVMWADVKKASKVMDSFDSALGYILFSRNKIDKKNQREVFRSLESEGVEFQEIGEIDQDQMSFEEKPADQGLQARISGKRSLHTDWQLVSYSSLTALTENSDDYRANYTGHLDGELIPVTGLPFGPNFGNAIHDCLEYMRFSDFGSTVQQVEEVERICLKYGVSARGEDVASLLKQVVTTPLFVDEGLNAGFTLSELDEAKVLKEMEFYYALGRVDTESINRILAGEEGVAELADKNLQGFLTGFIDLVFEHGGKYYIADYKTNYLGEYLEDYSAEKLLQAMTEHNYGLQFWIYSLVLHNHLKNVVEGYDVEQHFGGVFYLFVRGMTESRVNNGVFFTKPDSDKLNELQEAFERDERGNPS